MSDHSADLAQIIETRLLGVDPGDQDVVLEDDDWRRILAALRTPSPSTDHSAWQPIETAPKDGTLIILHGEGNTGTGRWRVIASVDTLNDLDGVAQFRRDYGWHSASDKRLNKIKVSHWMPLPPAPGASS